MGLPHNQSLSLGLAQPEVRAWEPEAELSAENNAIVLLGVLTFMLQLCLALLFLSTYWRYDGRIQQELKNPLTAGNLLTPVSSIVQLPGDLKSWNQQSCPYDVTVMSQSAVPSPAIPGPYCFDDRTCTDSLWKPLIPWDLVQH